MPLANGWTKLRLTEDMVVKNIIQLKIIPKQRLE
jgi:hypothetical protein